MGLRNRVYSKLGRKIYHWLAEQLDSIVLPCKIVKIVIGTSLRSHDDFNPLKDTCKAIDQRLLSDSFPSFHCLRIDQEAFGYFPGLNSRGMLEGRGGSW